MSGSGGESENGGGGSFLSAFDCGDCWPTTGLFTRALLIEGLVGAILGFLGLAAFTASCPSLIITSKGVGVYRLFISPLVSDGLFSGVFALFTIWRLATAMESNLGTVRLAHLFFTLSLGTNLLMFVVSLLLGTLGGISFFSNMCGVGLWPAAFGLMALDCMSSPEQPRRIMCFPLELASKFYPWLMLALMSLMMFTLDMGMVLGLCLGYLLHFRPELTLSLATATRWENHPRMTWLTTRPGFVSASSGGVSVHGDGSWGERASRDSSAPARFGIIHGGSAGSSASSAPNLSAFSGQGHRLGSATDSAPSSASRFSLAASSSASASANSTNDSFQANPRAAADARNQRAAAIEQRLGKMAKGETASSSSSARPSAIAPPPPIAPTATLERPPSPSLASSKHRAAAQQAVFSIGGDSDDDIYVDEEQQRAVEMAPIAALRAASAPDPEPEPEAEDESQQGFTQSRGKGKDGYAQVAAPIDDEDELDLEAGGADADAAADERTKLHTQR